MMPHKMKTGEAFCRARSPIINATNCARKCCMKASQIFNNMANKCCAKLSTLTRKLPQQQQQRQHLTVRQPQQAAIHRFYGANIYHHGLCSSCCMLHAAIPAGYRFQTARFWPAPARATATTATTNNSNTNCERPLPNVELAALIFDLIAANRQKC